MSIAQSPAVRTALIKSFGTAEAEACVAVDGGLSGAGVYRIRVGGIPYLLKVETQRDALNDPARWYPAMRAAAEAALAPRVVYACAEDGVAIMDYLPTRSLHEDYAGTREDMLVELAQAVRLLHETPAFPPLIDYLDGVAEMFDRFAGLGFVPAAALAPYRQAFDEVAAVYRRLPPELVSSHNDLNPRNVLYDGRRLWLVDWQAAFLADRYFDLAAVANFFTREEAEADLLARTYFREAPGAARSARFYLARQINHVFYGLVFLNLGATARPDARMETLEGPGLGELHRRLGEGEGVMESWDGRTAYGVARLNAALAGVRDRAFRAALAALDL